MAAAKKTLTVKPILRIRLRCAADHAHPWLARLYVLWATPTRTPADGHQGTAPVFHLAQTDADGYLSPTATELDPNPDRSFALVPDHEYLFYFVRHPGADLPTQMLKTLADDVEAAKKRWGEWQRLAPRIESTGTRNGKKVQEGVLRLSEQPETFVPRGSDLYGGWVLFRDMPGTGKNEAQADIQCGPLFDQVRRLQFHLGALRYPVGNQWHPYSPEPWTKGERGPELPPKPYERNEGVFDIVTWNAVMAFQQHAQAGRACVLDRRQCRTALLTPNTFAPTAAALDRRIEIRESPAYVSTVDADPSDAVGDIPWTSVVDKETGDAIRRWLAKGLRKPDKVLVARRAWDTWMCEDALTPVEALASELVKLGYVQGARFNNALRDVRMSVGKVSSGQVKRSVHKSGFAFDFTMHSFVEPASSYPIYFSREDPSSGDRTRWRVWAAVKEHSIPRSALPAHAIYVSSIQRWGFDGRSREGGSSKPFTLAGHKFLDFTSVAASVGLERISAHKSGWQGGPATTHTLADTDALRTMTAELGKAIEASKWAPEQEVVINESDRHALPALRELFQTLSLWTALAGRLGARPDVDVDPTTKEGMKLIVQLRRRFTGRKVRMSTLDEPTPASPTTPATTQPTYTVTDLIVDASTEFPRKQAFTLRPITNPVALAPGDTISIPALGHPAHMEWWHFQYTAGFSGKTWGDILGAVGWTEAGLIGRPATGARSVGGVYGHWGLGYSPEDLAAEAR